MLVGQQVSDDWDWCQILIIDLMQFSTALNYAEKILHLTILVVELIRIPFLWEEAYGNLPCVSRVNWPKNMRGLGIMV